MGLRKEQNFRACHACSEKVIPAPVSTTVANNSSKSGSSDVNYNDLSGNYVAGSGLRANMYQSSNGMLTNHPEKRI